MPSSRGCRRCRREHARARHAPRPRCGAVAAAGLAGSVATLSGRDAVPIAGLAVAVVAKELAKRAKKPFVEEAFLAGMVHDLGLLVTLQTWPEKLQNVCDEVRKTGRPFVEVEREFVGVDHQRLGEGLATRWKFPRVCAQVAGHHHDQRANPDDIAAVGWVREGSPGPRWRSYVWDLQRGNLVVQVRVLTDGRILERDVAGFTELLAERMGNLPAAAP